MPQSMRPFPRQILDAISSLREDVRGDNRWLEWQPDKRASTKMALMLVTLGERQPRSRYLWGTWERPAAAGMEWALKQAGVLVYGGRDWGLDWEDGEAHALWFMPQASASD